MPVGGQQVSYFFCGFVQRHRITELHVQPPCLPAFLSLPLALGFRETSKQNLWRLRLPGERRGHGQLAGWALALLDRQKTSTT
jgi:hypothetical protein